MESVSETAAVQLFPEGKLRGRVAPALRDKPTTIAWQGRRKDQALRGHVSLFGLQCARSLVGYTDLI